MKAAQRKEIDKAAIESAAKKACMTVAELVEWGMHSVIETFSDSEHTPGDLKEYLPSLRNLRGAVAAGVIRQSPVERFLDAEGVSMNELAEAAILSAISMVEDSEYPNKTPLDFLNDARRERRLLLPEIGSAAAAESVGREQTVHLFFQRLFSGDLKAVHGESFGDLCSDHVEGVHLFLKQCLDRALKLPSWDEAISELMDLEAVVRHCPKLRNEAAAIRAIIEAEGVLGNFCRAVAAA